MQVEEPRMNVIGESLANYGTGVERFAAMSRNLVARTVSGSTCSVCTGRMDMHNRRGPYHMHLQVVAIYSRVALRTVGWAHQRRWRT